MAPLFKQPNAVSCFYCQSSISPLPRDPHHFRCRHCDCWNHYDRNGEIVSDDAAMHDESLNARSFAKRASPRKDRLPSMYGGTHLCHTCQTNQMLLTQLLSKYLPPPEDPQYEIYLERLPEYKRSIEMRYPPVCDTCGPLVEEAIRKGDQMARVRALAGALKTTRGTDDKRRSLSTQKAKDQLERQLRLWKVRGCLWVGTLVCAVTCYSLVAASYRGFNLPSHTPSAIPFLVIISVLWAVWDPTYAVSRRSRFQGRAVRVHGKRQYNVLQFIAWTMRVVTAVMLYLSRYQPRFDPVHLWSEPHAYNARAYCSVMLVCEVAILIISALVLNVHYPPPVRLVDTTSHLRQSSTAPSGHSTRQSTPAISGPDLFATLSITNNPSLTTHNPIFGVPSLSTSVGPSGGMDVDIDDERDPDAMDIDSSPVKRPQRAQHEDDGSWLRPQRFFAPEEPTGLESLFAQTIRLADPHDQHPSASQIQGTGNNLKIHQPAWQYLIRDWRIWLALAVVPLCAIGYRGWDLYRRNTIKTIV